MPYTPPVDWHDQDVATALTAARMKAMESALATYTDNTAIPKQLLDAKGDLIVASGSDAAVRLAKGTENQVLQTSAASASGLAWVGKGMVSAGDPQFNLPTNGTSAAQTAINTAGATCAITGGGICRVPPGNYTLTGPINHNFNSDVYWDFRGCTFTLSGTGIIGWYGNPGGYGAGGGIIGGLFNMSGTQIGVKLRNSAGFKIHDTVLSGGGTGVLFSNDAGGYNENHYLENVVCNSNTTPWKWEAVNGGDPSMEGQTLVGCYGGGGSVNYDIGTGTSMESVEWINCRAMCAGVNNATAVRTRGDLKGWKVSMGVEKLITSPGIDNIVMNNDAGTTNNHLARIRMHVLPQTTGAGQTNTWAASPFVKDASVPFPTIIYDGNNNIMGGSNGGYQMQIRRDFEPQPRLRVSYAGIEAGPGASTAVDNQFFRAAAGQWTMGTGNVTIGDANASTDAAAARQVVGQVNHGATAGTARPAGFTTIQWIGSVEPTNAINGDTWIDTNS